MSWKDLIQNEFVIITADGQQFKPLCKNFNKDIEYYVSIFDFPEQDGSLTKRGRRRGYKFDLELYFQGSNHVDDVKTFIKSANQPGHWTIIHPYYGQIKGDPLSLHLDDSSQNVTVITGPFVESIDQENPRATDDPVDKTIADKAITDENFAQSFSNNITPDGTDKNKMTANNTVLYNKAVNKIKSPINAQEYFNFFNDANTAILNATAEPLAAMRAIQAFISYPLTFESNIQSRIQTLVDQFNGLRISVSGIVRLPEKKLYELTLGSLLSTMAAASATKQPGDYGSRTEIFAVTEKILQSYNTYIDDLDSLQSENGGELNSYIPDADSVISLSDLINYTVSNLFTIAMGAKQERSIILEENSNVILLATRFYGLKPDDSTLLTFINQNKIGLNELLQVKKGRKIIYYV